MLQSYMVDKQRTILFFIFACIFETRFVCVALAVLDSVDHAVLELKRCANAYAYAYASRVLGLKRYAVNTWFK